MNTLLATGDVSIISSLGGILAGLSELLLALGTGIGFVIRLRRANRRERLRTETAAALAAQEAKKVLEERLEKQHAEQIEQMKSQIKELLAMHNLQIGQYETQLKDLRQQNRDLLDRILSLRNNHGREPR